MSNKTITLGLSRVEDDEQGREMQSLMPDSGPVSPSDTAEEPIHCNKITPLDREIESTNRHMISAVRLIAESEDIAATQDGDCFFVHILAGPQKE